MRLFLAIELSESARGHLVGVQEALRPVGKASWVRGENLHLTVKFLGEVPDPRIAEICAGLEAVRGRAMTLRAEGLLCFPPNGPIRIVGAALTAAGELLELAEQIETACESMGFGREGRAYTPHVTLARAKTPLPGALRRQFAEASASFWPGPSFDVSRFVLMESRLLPQGPQYHPAARFILSC